MPLFNTWKCGDARFAIWHVTETLPELRLYLSDSRLPYDEELGLLKSPTRKIEYTGTRVLLSLLCGEEKHIVHLPSGKPYCPDGNFHLTISHTQGYVAVGICPTAEVGIDIEYLSSRVLKVTDKFLSSEEIAQLPQSQEAKTIQALLAWSAKETAFKVLGESGVDFSKHLHLAPFHTANKLMALHLTETRTAKRKAYTIYAMVNEAFVCTWCISEPSPNPTSFSE